MVSELDHLFTVDFSNKIDMNLGLFRSNKTRELSNVLCLKGMKYVTILH